MVWDAMGYAIVFRGALPQQLLSHRVSPNSGYLFGVPIIRIIYWGPLFIETTNRKALNPLTMKLQGPQLDLFRACKPSGPCGHVPLDLSLSSRELYLK